MLRLFLSFLYLAAMKLNGTLLFMIGLIFFLSCEEGSEVYKREKNIKKKSEIFKIYLNQKIKKTALTDSLAKKNKNFKKLIDNFTDTVYTIELLRDKTKQNMSYIHPLTLRRKQSLLDTPAVKSRLVLTRMHINKLNYLINNDNLEKDTIEKTFNSIVKDINNLIYVAEKYRRKKDEFKEILEYDSIMKDTTRKLDKNKINTLRFKKILKEIPKNIH